MNKNTYFIILFLYIGSIENVFSAPCGNLLAAFNPFAWLEILLGPPIPNNPQSPAVPGQAITPTSNTPFPINTANPLTNLIPSPPVQPNVPVSQAPIPAIIVPTPPTTPQIASPPAQTIVTPNTAALAPAPIPAPTI